MPSDRDTTNHTGRIIDLWVNSWIAALAVGILTWALILWCMVAYRRRKNETGYPRQLSYNLPLEIFYTAVPLFMVLVLFYFTNQDITAINKENDDPDVVIDVRAKQWSWDFNYVKEDKYYQGTQVNLDGTEVSADEFPTLVLPVDQSIELQLNTRDVQHSFWVPAFLQKMDIYPGRTNIISLETGKTGTFDGKCAELCGEYHSEMLFNVEVVTEDQYNDYVETLPSGQVDGEYDRQYNSESSEVRR